MLKFDNLCPVAFTADGGAISSALIPEDDPQLRVSVFDYVHHDSPLTVIFN